MGKKRVFAPLLLAASLFFGGLTSVEPGTQTGESRFALAQVIDSRGKALVDIGVDDFVVQEAGAERELLDVRVADYPLVIVVDNGAGARDDFAMLQSAVARFLNRLGPRPVTLITTAETPTAVATFDDDRATVASKLDGLELVDAPSQLLRASALAGATIKRTGTLFSTIVVATASATEDHDADDAEPLAPIIDSRAVVHTVANVGRIGTADQLLRGLTAQTHGDYIPIYVPASYQPAFDRLATRLTTEMLIEYLVPSGSKAADVKIGVRLPGAHVRGLGVAPR